MGYSPLKSDYPDTNWKVAVLPKANNGNRKNGVFTAAIGANAHSKFPRASAALTIYLTSKENQAEIAKTGFAYPTHPDQLDLIVDPNDKAIARGGVNGVVAYWGQNTGKIHDQVAKALERIYLGSQTVTESFSMADQKVNEILADD